MMRLRDFIKNQFLFQCGKNLNLAVIEDDTENITEEEMEDIAAGVYIGEFRDKETKRISSMSYNERYKTGEL